MEIETRLKMTFYQNNFMAFRTLNSLTLSQPSHRRAELSYEEVVEGGSATMETLHEFWVLLQLQASSPIHVRAVENTNSSSIYTDVFLAYYWFISTPMNAPFSWVQTFKSTSVLYVYMFVKCTIDVNPIWWNRLWSRQKLGLLLFKKISLIFLSYIFFFK